MRVLLIKVANKVATYVKSNETLVCGNSDFVLEFAFDSEWFTHDEKIARFIWGGKYVDVVFTGTTCPVPPVFNTDEVRVGIYAGDLCSTTPAVVPCKKSILCGTGSPRDEEEPHYISDALEAAEEAKAAAEEAKRAAGGGQNFANALKGSATGSAVLMDDVSPLEHEMAVKVRSKNLFDNDTSKIEQVTYTNSSGTPGSKYGYAIRLPIGTYTIHAEAIDEATKEGEYYIYLAVNTKDGVYKSSGSPVKLQKYTDVTFTIDDGDVLYLYNGTSKGLTETQALFALFNIQIEQGTTATAYTPFVDVSAAKVRRYGKNLLDASKFNAANTTINGITFEQMGEGKVHVYGTIADNSKTILYASNVIKAANAKYISSGVYSIAQHAVGSRYVYMLARLNDANNKFLVNLQNENQSITTGGYLVGYSISVDRNITTPIDLVVDLQVEQGKNATAFEAFVESTEHTPNADGTVEGVTSLSPTTTLMTDTEGAVIDVEYNRDINKAFAELQQAVLTLMQ